MSNTTVEAAEIQQAAVAVDSASFAHAAAVEKANAASREATDALNRLNKAQAAFDDVVKRYRSQAERSTDWQRRNTPAVPV